MTQELKTAELCPCGEPAIADGVCYDCAGVCKICGDVCNPDGDKCADCRSRQLPTTAQEWLMGEVNPEVCVICGSYFDYRGGPQRCGKCRDL